MPSHHSIPFQTMSMPSGPTGVASAVAGSTWYRRSVSDDVMYSAAPARSYARPPVFVMKWNPTIKTVEIITCNSRHGTVGSKPLKDGTFEPCWVKSYTDQVKPALKKLGLTVKALPMGMGAADAMRWSILKFSPTTNTWLYVTAGGEKDTDAMWPAIHKVEEHPLFLTSKDFVAAGNAVKAADTLRKYTIDFGRIGELRDALVPLA